MIDREQKPTEPGPRLERSSREHGLLSTAASAPRQGSKAERRVLRLWVLVLGGRLKLSKHTRLQHRDHDAHELIFISVDIAATHWAGLALAPPVPLPRSGSGFVAIVRGIVAIACVAFAIVHRGFVLAQLAA